MHSAVPTDNQDVQIEERRDLEDFSRLRIYFGRLQAEIAAGTVRDPPEMEERHRAVDSGIKVYRMADATGSDSYLKEDTAASN